MQMFLYEGLAYDLLRGAVGALLGIAVAYVMVLVHGGAFGTTADITIALRREAARASSSPTRSACC